MQTGITLAIIALFCATAIADTHIRAQYTSDGRVTESSTYLKGERQRIEYGKETTVLNQADLKKVVQLNTKAKTYRIVPTEGEKPPASEPRKGGVITVTTSVIDTGERKQIFGFEARHLKTTIDRKPSPEACDSKADRVETDGWYIDLDLTPAPALSPTPIQSCQDEIRNEQTGGGKLGYPVQYKMTATGVMVSMEVVELSNALLDAALFEIPDGYSQEGGKMGGFREAPPKLANTTRIGVAFQNKSEQQFAAQALDDTIGGAFHDLVTDVVLLEAADIAASAKEKECDYLVYASLTEMKKSSVGKVGGLLSRASGKGSATENYEARLEYKLVRVGASEVLLESTALGKSGGGFDIRGAMRIATTAGSLAMSMTMYPRLFAMMGPGAGSGGGMPSLDPTLSSLSFLSRGSAAPKTEPAKAAPADITAVSAAFERAGKAVMTELHKKK